MPVNISRILHAGYIFESEGSKIAFDPIFEVPFSRNCYAFPPIQFDIEEVKKLHLDAVFISHIHDDHCSLESLNLLDRKTPIFIYSVTEEIPDLISRLGFASVTQIFVNRVIQIGSFEITPRRALDVDVDCLFQIQTKEHNILNVVDSWIDWETLELLKQQQPWDLILWPFQSMRELEVLSPIRFGFPDPEIPVEHLNQLRALNPRAVVPSSCQFLQEPWSWYNESFFPISYTFFETQIKKVLPDANVIRLNPGKSLQVKNHRFRWNPSLTWIIPTGDQDVDYTYNQNLKVPPLSEIAQKFELMNYDQKKRVEYFLKSEIPSIFQELDPLDSNYFLKPRIWELQTFSGLGENKKYLFRIDGKSLEPIANTQEPVAWLTEIAESKIYSALVNGESLSSLYIRINNIFFSAQIESELLDVDATMDPLVRCLFSKNPVSYQRAQLDQIIRDQNFPSL